MWKYCIENNLVVILKIFFFFFGKFFPIPRFFSKQIYFLRKFQNEKYSKVIVSEYGPRQEYSKIIILQNMFISDKTEIIIKRPVRGTYLFSCKFD